MGLRKLGRTDFGGLIGGVVYRTLFSGKRSVLAGPIASTKEGLRVAGD